MLQRTQNNLRVFCQSMAERENGEEKVDITIRNWLWSREYEEKNRDLYTPLLSGDTLCKILDEGLAEEERALAELWGDKPYPGTKAERVANQLAMIDSGFGGYAPDRSYKHIRLDRKSKDDIYMIREGFSAIAYEHLHGGFQSKLHDHFRRNLEASEYVGGKSVERYNPDTPFDQDRREFSDRFELTYEQAKALQQIAKRANLSYDPGGREITPENIAKRTFRAKDYLDRPIEGEGITGREKTGYDKVLRYKELRRKNK